MTDTEFFVAMRDVLVGLTGSWSANAIYQHALLAGIGGKRTATLEAIKKACGESGKRGGPKPRVTGFPQMTLTGSRIAPGTSSQLVPEREKKEAKKRESYIPKLDTSYLAKGAENAEIEPAIVAWLEYQIEKRGAQFTLRAAQIAVAAIARAARKHGTEWTVETLERTIDKGADLGYFNVVAKNALTGSRVPRRDDTLTGSQPTLLTDFEADFERRQKERTIG